MTSSRDESGAAAFPRHEYDAIERAVTESARGRWFLQEYSKRNRAADTQMLLDAIGRLQGAIAPRTIPEIASLTHAIKATRADMAAVRNDMLPDGGAIADNASIYAAIAGLAKKTANDTMTGVQRVQSVAHELKAANANDPQAARLEADANALQSVAWSQDILSQRVAKAMGLLSNIDDRLSALAKLEPAPPADPRHDRYFAGNADLFASPPISEKPRPEGPPAPPQAIAVQPQRGATVIVHRMNPVEAAAPAGKPLPPEEQPSTEISSTGYVIAPASSQPERKRIVIIRKPRGEAGEIPLTNELPELPR
jgi:hypothetical protein